MLPSSPTAHRQTWHPSQTTTRIADSTLFVVPVVTMVTEIFRATYTEQDTIEKFLNNVFGEGNATVQVRSFLLMI